MRVIVNHYKTIRYFIMGLVLSRMAMGCLDRPDCVFEGDNRIEINFLRLEEVDDELRNVQDTLIFQRIYALNSNALYAFQDTIFTPFILLINPNDTVTTFVFERLSGTDTLVLNYDSRPGFVSENCGFNIELTNMEVARHTFDSLKVNNLDLEIKNIINFEVIN